MFNVYIVSICVFSVRAHLIWSLALLCVPYLRPSFLCLVQIYIYIYIYFFFSLVSFSIVIKVKAKINK